MANQARIAGAVLMVVVVSVFSFLGARSAVRVPENSAFIIKMCEANNRQDAQSKLLWNQLLDLAVASVANRTPEQEAAREKRLTELRALVDDAYAPIECKIERNP